MNIHQQNAKAITLIELMMVILIIGVLTLLSAPLITNFGVSVKLKNVAENVAGSIRLARTYAVTKNMKHAAVIYTSNSGNPYANLSNHIVIQDESGMVDKPWKAPSLISLPDIFITTTGADEQVTGSYCSILFNERGLIESIITSGGTTSGSSVERVSVHIIKKGTKVAGNPYNSGGSYGAADQGDRAKCPTIFVSESGRVRVHNYGIDDPWAAATSDEE